MGCTVVQVEFDIEMPVDKYRQIAVERAAKFLDVPGLRWKLWPLDEQTRRGGGVYLFDDEASARAYVDGPIVAALRSTPGLANVRIKLAGVIEDASRITEAPI